MTENEIGTLVIEAAIAVHRELGPGLLETVYEAVLARELQDRGLKVERQVPVPIRYKDLRFDEGFRADIVVAGKVILPGPDGDFDRLRTPSNAQGLIPPSVEAQLNERQKRIMVQVQTEGSVTSGWCRKTFGVTYDTAYRDLSDLVERGILVQLGKGRSTRYELDVEAR